MNTISLNDAVSKLQNTNDKFFSVYFEKKNGEERKMVCRTGVKKHVKGTGLKYSPTEHGLLTVWDSEKRDYRMINLKQLRAIQVQGETFVVELDS